ASADGGRAHSGAATEVAHGPLDSTAARAAVHDRHLQPAVRLGALHPAAHGEPGLVTGAAADHLLNPDRRPDVPLAVSGRARGSLRSARTTLDRHPDLR